MGGRRATELLFIIRHESSDQADLTTQEQGNIKELELIDGLVYRKCRLKRLFVVFKGMRKGIVITTHDLSGYFGVDRTVANIM